MKTANIQDIRVPEPVPLRPHHLLCIQNFRGKGYSPSFVAKMTEVCAHLRSAPIRLVSGADVLCESCPNCRDGRCSSGKPEQFDALVLAQTGLSTDLPVSAAPGAQALPFLTEELLELCCPGCQWLSLCKETLREEAG